MTTSSSTRPFQSLTCSHTSARAKRLWFHSSFLPRDASWTPSLLVCPLCFSSVSSVFPLKHGTQTMLDQCPTLKLLPLLLWTLIFLFMGLTFSFYRFHFEDTYNFVSEITSSSRKTHLFLGHAARLYLPDSFQLYVAPRMKSSKWHASRRDVCHFSTKYLGKWASLLCPSSLDAQREDPSRWRRHEMAG